MTESVSPHGDNRPPQPFPPTQPGPPGQYQWVPVAPPRTTNVLAVVAFVLSLVLPILPFVTVPMAHVARKQIREREEGGDAFAVIALVLAYPLFCALMLALTFIVGRIIPLPFMAMGAPDVVLVAVWVVATVGLLAAEIWLWVRWVKRLRPDADR
ncbi:DUF4190 domain-containing protein [Tsukamurella pseudospumae]|uniref:DUF4190 domain-containing protein n=1 Tax=Tsukamurella pseudospumae TaxID=239498 RepID=A0A137ZYY1_9ACTN|nr:DUF4190 domain-containing protein [Tsukamurella pseudospumae]KXO97938.1 hypothetical protein AXK61_20425 [Tsukamurella pseudospumae]KXP03411.1 hypothetical protein AXK60_16420 [Tsukamurella pseudospumae]